MTNLLRHTFGIGLLLLAGVAQAAPVAFDLSATSGTTTLPDGTTSGVLGYALAPATTVAAPGGPVLVVTEGDVVTVNLTNALLGESTALHFQGQAIVPDEVGVAPGGTRSYTFTATSPGTFLYEAGLAPGSAQQVARGLYGMLVVRPAIAGQAYGSAATAFDSEAFLVLSELDPALNGSATPAAFDLRNFKPRYYLINGRAFPATARIPAVPGGRVLLRYVNAGQQQHSMTVLGVDQLLVGKDGSPRTYPGRRAAETIAPGETLDAIATVPPSTTPGSRFAVLDGSLMLVNGTATGAAAGFGGMLTFLEAGTAGGGGADTVGPVAQNVAVGPIVGGSVAISATLSDAASGGANVVAAEYYVDAGTIATSMSGSFGSVQVTVTGSLAVGTLASGNHTIYVRGRDALGNWGARGSAVLSIDTAGPATSGLVLAPAATRGTAGVTLTGTGSDQASGGGNVTAAEYFMDAPGANGAGALVTVSPGTSPVANLTATIPATTLGALPDGTHPVHVHSRDAGGNWGPFASVALVVDKTVGPVVSGLAANPAASNGTTGFNSSIAAVRVTVTATDALSNVVAVEGFIDGVGAAGTGFVFVPSDGQWNGKTENAFGDIPLSTVNALTLGSHTISVRALDAAGNWGAAGTTTLLVDKTAPTLTGISLAPGTAIVGEAVTLTPVGASDAASGIAGGQYWFDTATPPAFPSSFTGATATISSATGGVRTVYARVRDGAGNWSPVRNATLLVPSAVDDARTVTATVATQTQTINQGAPGLLANDLPIGRAGRTVALVSAPVRVAGAGAGTLTLACAAGQGTAGALVGGSTICTNGAYQLRLNPVGSTNNARQASKRGTFRFTYTETLNGKTTPAATVTVTVN